MSNKEAHIEHLSEDQIEHYLNGNLSDREMHAVERHLLTCELCADALEGYENASHDVNIKQELAELNKTLNRRISSTKKDSKYNLLRIAAIALVLIVSAIFISNYFLNDIRNPQFSEKKVEKKKEVEGEKKVEDEKEVEEVEEAEEEEEEEVEGEKGKKEAEGEKEEIKKKRDPDPVLVKKNTDNSFSNSGASNTSINQPIIVEEELIVEYTIPLTDQDSELIPTVVSAKAESRANYPTPSNEGVPTPQYSESSIEKIAEPKFAKGSVKDAETNEGVYAATIINEDKEVGVVSDMDGSFEIEAEEGDELTIESIGYKKQKIEISGDDNTTITMQSDVMLDEVIISESTIKKNDYNAHPSVGDKAYKVYLIENVQFPQAATDAGIKGKVIIGFQLDSLGKMSDFVIVKSLGYGCDEEAIRLIQEGPAWQVAIKNGQAILQEVKVKIIFK